MLIKFVKPDPRAGLVVQLDDANRRQQLIDSGAAVEHKPKAEQAPPPKTPDLPPVRHKGK